MTYFSPRILYPEANVSGNGSRVMQQTWDGCAYYLKNQTYLSKLLCRINATTLAPTASILFFKETQYGYPCSRVASFNFSPIVGNQEITPAEGSILLYPGTVYVLFGRTSLTGSATIRTYTVVNNDLLTSNVDSQYNPVVFTTTLLTTSSLTTFDPRVIPTGQAIESSLDLVPIFRIRSN